MGRPVVRLLNAEFLTRIREQWGEVCERIALKSAAVAAVVPMVGASIGSAAEREVRLPPKLLEPQSTFQPGRETSDPRLKVFINPQTNEPLPIVVARGVPEVPSLTNDLQGRSGAKRTRARTSSKSSAQTSSERMLQIPRTTVLREFPRSGDDAVDAARVMSDWLENVNPGEWQCYKREPNLHLQRQKFIQEFMKVQFLVNGLEVDTAAMAPSCSLPKTNRDRSVLKAFGRMIVKGLKKSFRDAVSSSLPVGADMLADKLYGHLTNDDTTSLDPKDVSEGRMAAAAALVFMFLGEKAAQDFPHDPPDTQALKVVQAAQVLNANRRWPYPAVLVDSFGGGFWSLLVRSPFYGESHPDTKRYGKAGDLERSRIITDYYNKQFGDVLRGLGEAKDDLDISIIQRALGEELPSDATSLVHDVFGAEVAARYRAARVEAPGDALKIAASAIVIHRVMYWARGRLQ